jgi:hypothetical protein
MFSQQRLVALAAAAFGYVVKFFTYGILTAAVLLMFAANEDDIMRVCGLFTLVLFLLAVAGSGDIPTREMGNRRCENFPGLVKMKVKE